MDFTQITDGQVDSMLRTVGVDGIDDLFAPIPADQRLNRELNLPSGCSEPELLARIDELARRNRSIHDQVCFLGCGAYDHFIPAVVDHLAMRGEFLTAYTPYQAEASQGTLQAFYEFQTMVCQITGMEIANASLYENASAVAEAVLMARSITSRSRVVVSATCHPDTLETLLTYTRQHEIEVTRVSADAGVTDMDALRSAMDDSVMAVVVQLPNFFGCLEDIEAQIEIAHQAGALAIVSFDPIASGVVKRPGDLGADIVVGEGQPLGIPLQYGGPYLGLLACRKAYLRKMPGRVVGRARDVGGRRGFCLVLQTREQHIKRERATSNICTNQGLMAVRAAVYMSAMGRTGIAKVASACLDKAHYAAAEISKLDGYELKFDAPFFKEFVVQTTRDVGRVMEKCRERSIQAGVPLGRWFGDMRDCFTVAVTERRSKSEIDALVQTLECA